MKTCITSVISLISLAIIALVAIIRNQRDVAKEAIRALAFSGGIESEGGGFSGFSGLNMPVSSRRGDTQKLLFCHSRRLQKLKEKKAILGIFADSSLDMEIEDIEATIEELKLQGGSSYAPKIEHIGEVY